MTPIQSAWMINSGNQIVVCKRNLIFFSYGICKIFTSFTLNTTEEIFIFNWLIILIRELAKLEY